MPGLADLQASFIDFLSGRNGLITGSVADQGGMDAETRLGIYRNAYRIRLKQALETDHEMLGIYLGDELFEVMADGYIDAHPSGFTSLRRFGDRLPAYLQQAEPFSRQPVISELARFERHLLDVFDAADSERTSLSELRALPPEDWPGMKLGFHPGTRLFSARWNSIEIWKALKAGQTPPEAQPLVHACWLLWRGDDLLSGFRPVDEDEHTLLSKAIGGSPFAEMCESLLSRHNAMHISAICLEYMTRWFEQGIIREIRRT